jgi:uncharacterized protein YejL (UPF0352 family)
MDIVKLILDALGANGLKGVVDAVISAVGPGGLTAVLLISAYFAAQRIKKIPQADHPQSQYSDKIIDKLMKDLSEAMAKESDCDKRISILTKRIEVLEREKAELELRLEREKAELTSRIDAMFALLKHDSSVYSHKSDETEIGSMRKWMYDHLSPELLIVVAADAGLSKPTGENFELQILSLVDEARRLNLIPKLTGAVIAKAPSVRPWFNRDHPKEIR